MTERPKKFDGEDRQTEDLAPENQNAEQDDESTQAQTFADEALGRSSDDFGLDDTKKVSSGDDSDDVEDLVDHMNQMVRSGRIDNDAYRGERNDDDEEEMYGEDGEDD
jgi:hypothetical protein